MKNLLVFIVLILFSLAFLLTYTLTAHATTTPTTVEEIMIHQSNQTVWAVAIGMFAIVLFGSTIAHHKWLVGRPREKWKRIS